MTESLKDIIQKLEHQRMAIDRALTALHEIDGTPVESELVESTAPAASDDAVAATRKGGMTAEGRRRLSEALKKRWAAKRAASGHVSPGRPAKRKGGMTPEGRKRLSEALRQRWAAKRAASAAPAKRARKK
jgi:hypothetical protein